MSLHYSNRPREDYFSPVFDLSSSYLAINLVLFSIPLVPFYLFLACTPKALYSSLEK